jgi:hypothetical protein
VKTFYRLGLAIVCAAALSAMLPASSRADTIYTYTGNVFVSASSPYTITDSVSGWIDLSAPLGNSVGPLTITPVSFSFSDGVQTITNNNAASVGFDAFVTNAFGVIVNWDIGLSGVVGTITSINGLGGDLIFDRGTQGSVGSILRGLNGDSPGTWSVSTTPIPAALPLFASGLGAMGLLGWWRKRKNGAPLSA